MLVDIGIIIFLLAGFFIGFKRGFFRQIMRFVGSILSLVIAYLFADNMSSFVSRVVPAPNLSEFPPLELFGLHDMVEGLYFRIISFFLLFIVSKIVLTILVHIFNVVTKVPVLKQVNSIAGAAFGFAEAYLILSVLLLVVFHLPIAGIQAHLRDSFLTEPIVNSIMHIFGQLFGLWI